MKTGNLAARNHKALSSTVELAAKLADEFKLDKGLVGNLQVQRGAPEVRALQQREAVVDLLAALVEKLGLEKPKAETKVAPKAKAEVK